MNLCFMGSQIARLSSLYFLDTLVMRRVNWITDRDFLLTSLEFKDDRCIHRAASRLKVYKFFVHRNFLAVHSAKLVHSPTYLCIARTQVVSIQGILQLEQ
jgi:hypothetical protein